MSTKKVKPEGGETRSFAAETKELLKLMIGSLYSNKEVFLRELISNASDALDALRFAALTQPELQGEGELAIRIEPNAQARTLTISDNGIGMSRDEVVTNIGTIAKSGTKALVEAIQKSEAAKKETLEMIGQFGVGFYASFMVADKVTLVTRRAGEETATRWESEGDGEYSLYEAQKANPGTEITLHLKDADEDAGLDNFVEEWVLRRVVKKYSDFVRYPIKMEISREEVEREDDGTEKEGGKRETVINDETLNSQRTLWKRRQQDVTEDEYQQFYQQISHDWQKPAKTITISAEGRLEYQALLFLPSQAPFDLFQHEADYGLQLYVKNVRIIDNCADLLPRYLRFVKGVVDAADLPLNVSRELLQTNRQISQIKKGLVKKVLDTLAELKEKDSETYLQIWRAYGNALKEGIVQDAANKDKLTQLLLFESSRDAELTGLADYVGRMKTDQSEIYFLSGESRLHVESSPHLEAFAERGYEVLFFVDPVDEFMIQSLSEFDGKPLRAVGKGEVELGSEEERKKTEEERAQSTEKASGLLSFIKEELADYVQEVRLSNRLTSSPACLVAAEGDVSPHIEKLLRKSMGANAPNQKRILELNPKHPIFRSMKDRFESKSDVAELKKNARLIHGQALLAEGSELPDPSQFAELVAELMVANAGANEAPSIIIP